MRTQVAWDCAAPSDVWVSEGYQWSRVDSAHQQTRHQRQSAAPTDNQHERLSASLAGLLSLSLSLSNFHFPLCDTTLPEQWWEDVHCCRRDNTVSHKLSCARSLESIFTLIWVALLVCLSDSNSSDYRLIQIGHRTERKSMGNCLDCRSSLGKKKKENIEACM